MGKEKSLKFALSNMYYKGISWDENDLISSKQAVLILLREGISEEEISTLDFGNLDVDSVINE